MSRRANVPRHGANHKGRNSSGTGGGSDPAVLNIDSTTNVGGDQGVHSTSATGSEPEGYVLTATGDGGSQWAPSGAVFAPFYEAVASLASTRDLLGYWRLGEPSGTFADTSGQASPADGTLTASTTAMTRDVTGALPVADDDGAIQLNDSDGSGSDYITTSSGGDGSRFNLSAQNLTIAAWLNPTASASSFLGGVIGQLTTSGLNQRGWALRVEWPLRRAEFIRVQDGGGTAVDLYGPPLDDGTWTFVVATYNTADGHRLYYNGLLVASDATTFSGTGTANIDPYIGRSGIGNALFITSFYGGLDEISVWGETLTADEILTLAASGGLDATSSFLIAEHIADTSDAHDASAISFTPAAGIAATDVQAAIVEDAGDLAAHLTDTADAHDASAVSVADTAGYFTGTDVEAVLAELGNTAAAAAVWMPLTTVVSGAPELVWDADDSLIPTLVPV